MAGAQAIHIPHKQISHMFCTFPVALEVPINKTHEDPALIPASYVQLKDVA